MSLDTLFNSRLNRRDLLKLGLKGCLAMGVSSGFFLGGCTRGKKYAGRPNVILITLDTTRADHLGCYGYHRATSPNIDKLAEKSVLYSRAVAPSCWTLPSHASLFTGKFTSSHGAKYDLNGPLRILDAIEGPDIWKDIRARGLSKDETTLADFLKKDGYATGAVVAGPWMKKIFGLHKGFDFYDDEEISELNGRTADQVTESAVKWVKKVKGNNFFLFLNYFDAHAPYLPPSKYDVFSPRAADFREDFSHEEKGAFYKARYDGEILYMDYHIGQLFLMLESENLVDNTLIVITADHGDLLGEHGKFGHGTSLYQEEIHIPLIIKYPGSEVNPYHDGSFVQLNDVFGIILKYLGIKMPASIQSGVPPEIGHPVISEVYPLTPISKGGSWRAIYHDAYKFLWNSNGQHRLYNVKRDPREKENLIQKEESRANRMYAELETYLSKLPLPGSVDGELQVDEETKKALKSLGYIQ